MQLDFSKNYFDLFGIDKGFAVDERLLHERWQALQRELHPDNFSAATEAERRFSMQASSYVNEAHKVLGSPLARAGYLLKLEGIDLDTETDTRMAPEFLMDQMELREQIEEIESGDDAYSRIDTVRASLKSRDTELGSRFAQQFAKADYTDARETARQWQFIDKLQREVAEAEERLDDAL